MKEIIYTVEENKQRESKEESRKWYGTGKKDLDEDQTGSGNPVQEVGRNSWCKTHRHAFRLMDLFRRRRSAVCRFLAFKFGLVLQPLKGSIDLTLQIKASTFFL